MLAGMHRLASGMRWAWGILSFRHGAVYSLGAAIGGYTDAGGWVVVAYLHPMIREDVLSVLGPQSWIYFRVDPG